MNMPHWLMGRRETTPDEPLLPEDVPLWYTERRAHSREMLRIGLAAGPAIGILGVVARALLGHVPGGEDLALLAFLTLWGPLAAWFMAQTDEDRRRARFATFRRLRRELLADVSAETDPARAGERG